jgi:hypothetical protein
MSLLESIIADAMGDAPVAQVLRKLKVLATRVKAEPLLQWVDRELYGYRAGDLPTYRGPFHSHALGSYFGPFNFRIENHVINKMVFPEEVRDSDFFMVRVYNPIAEVADMAARSGGTRWGWSGEAVALYNGLIRSGKGDVSSDLACTSVFVPIPETVYIGVLDSVRNRALELALELETEAPEAGEVNAPEATKTNAQKVIQNFDLTGANFSGSNNALGSADVGQKSSS